MTQPRWSEFPPILRPGDQIISHDGARIGRIGLLLADRRGGVFGLSVNTVAEAGRSPCLLLDESSRRALGPAELVFPFQGGERRSVNLLVTLQIPPGIQVELDPFIVAREQPLNAPELADGKVVINSTDGRRKGHLQSIGSIVPLENADSGSIELFLDSLGFITDSSSVFAHDGDAGTAIFSEHGHPLALVFAADDETVFGIPLRALFTNGRFILLGEEAAAKHNRRQPASAPLAYRKPAVPQIHPSNALESLVELTAAENVAPTATEPAARTEPHTDSGILQTALRRRARR